MKNNQNGRSMVEMLGVLAIIGVLSAGGLAGYSKAMFKHKLNNTMEQITMLVTNIRTMYGTQKSYAGLDTSKARELGAMPASIGADNKNPFKGTVTVGAAQARKGVDNSGFTVTYTNLPKDACIALATADFGSGAGSGFVGVVVQGDTGVGNNNSADTSKPYDPELYIGSGAGKTDGETTTKARGEGEAYQMAAAITACQEPSTIIWKFY